jgi:hypothetical protein
LIELIEGIWDLPKLAIGVDNVDRNLKSSLRVLGATDGSINAISHIVAVSFNIIEPSEGPANKVGRHHNYSRKNSSELLATDTTKAITNQVFS